MGFPSAVNGNGTDERNPARKGVVFMNRYRHFIITKNAAIQFSSEDECIHYAAEFGYSENCKAKSPNELEPNEYYYEMKTDWPDVSV